MAMPMYAISLVPLIRHLSGVAYQVWYADDAVTGGSISQLREWWSCLESAGCHLGYFTNAKKTWLVVKQEHLDSARKIFAGTGIQVTSTGRPTWVLLLAQCSSCRSILRSVFGNGLRVSTV